MNEEGVTKKNIRDLNNNKTNLREKTTCYLNIFGQLCVCV